MMINDWLNLAHTHQICFLDPYDQFVTFFIFIFLQNQEEGFFAIWPYCTTGVKLFHEGFYQKPVETQAFQSFRGCHGPAFDSKLSFFLIRGEMIMPVMQYREWSLITILGKTRQTWIFTKEQDHPFGIVEPTRVLFTHFIRMFYWKVKKGEVDPPVVV